MNPSQHLIPGRWLMAAVGIGVAAAIGCGGTEVVERVVKETVVVEKPVEKVVKETVKETVVVEKPVEKVVEKQVVQTVIVERPIEKILVATPTPRPLEAQTGLRKGTIVAADVSVPAPIFRNALLAWPASVKILQWGFTNSLLFPDPSVEPPARGEAVPGIATAWEVAPDQSKITFKIREGVQFHKGWGELTASDVAFSFNDIHSEGSSFARRGELEQWVARWEAVDPQTVVVHVKQGQLSPTWWRSLTWSNAPTIFSEKVFKAKGEKEAHLTTVGTGPWSVTSWKEDEEINAAAVENHWHQTPRMTSLKIVEIPEDSTRIAAWKTGAVDIAFIPLAFLASTLESVKGSWTVPISDPRGQHVAFAGNYWIQEPHDPTIVTKKEVFPRPGLDKSLPWVGDPRDPASMEKARLVRTALALAIDRETIAKGVLKGFARPMHAWLFPEDSPHFKAGWKIPFDQKRAKELLTQAGFPNGFKMPFNVPPDSPVINVQVGEAIAQMWKNLGIDVKFQSPAYAAARASLVDRSSNTPWLMHDKNFVNPPDTAFGMAVLATRGFSFGMELDKVSATYVLNRKEQDEKKRIQNNIEVEDWLHQWMPWAPAVQQFEVWAVRPEVKEWKPLGDDENIAHRFETAVIERK